MRLHEIEGKLPVIRMTKRFVKEFAEFSRAFPAVDKTYEEFLKAKQADPRAPFGKKDGPSKDLFVGWNHCHLVFGKVIVHYRASSTAVEVARMTDHLSLENAERARSLNAYLSNLGDGDFQEVPTDVKPQVDIAAAKRALMTLFYEMAAHKDDRKMLDAFMRGTSDDALEFVDAAELDVSKLDKEMLRGWAREALHHIPLAEGKQPRFTAQQIDAAIKAATKGGKRHYGYGGNCAIFAVTLNKVLGGIGTCVYVDSEDSYEYVDHVALRVNGHYFDGSGLISENALKQYGIGDTYEDENEVEIHEVDDESVLSMVDSTGGGMSSPINAEALETDLRAAFGSSTRRKAA